jgi:CYTH domain-containing protein
MDRRPGEGRYARVEREQRWTVATLPPGATPAAEIYDRYLIGTRLRLRRVHSDGTVVFKLTQKIRPDPANPETVKLTNLYLSEAEHERLTVLPAAELRKTRWRLEWNGRAFAVDELHGPLQGLILAEVELGPDDALWPLPPFACREVTHDDRFSGAALAQLTHEQIPALLARA